MNLTKALKAKIVEQFLFGESVVAIAHWYDKPGSKIEEVLREDLRAKNDWIADQIKGDPDAGSEQPPLL